MVDVCGAGDFKGLVDVGDGRLAALAVERAIGQGGDKAVESAASARVVAVEYDERPSSERRRDLAGARELSPPEHDATDAEKLELFHESPKNMLLCLIPCLGCAIHSATFCFQRR